MKLRRQGLIAAVVPAIGHGGVTRDESHWARLAKKGHKPGELSEECRDEKSHGTRAVLGV
jgi:hypothetical protein